MCEMARHWSGILRANREAKTGNDGVCVVNFFDKKNWGDEKLHRIFYVC